MGHLVGETKEDILYCPKCSFRLFSTERGIFVEIGTNDHVRQHRISQERNNEENKLESIKEEIVSNINNGGKSL
ncbi:hypothetical protein FKM82_013003 [Ascaphus truei]